MAGMKLIVLAFEAPRFSVIMISFMGPAAVSVVILMWWLFASRASLKEKLVGLGGAVCAAVIAALCLHFSMKGMSFALYVLPTGSALFALALILLANRAKLRLPVALVATTIGFGGWELVQMHGVTGKFSPVFSWRWSPTAEQEYLKSLADQNSDSKNEPANPGEIITRASAPWSDFRGPNRDSNLPGVTRHQSWHGRRKSVQDGHHSPWLEIDYLLRNNGATTKRLSVLMRRAARHSGRMNIPVASGNP
jgi:hypothetical protein